MTQNQTSTIWWWIVPAVIVAGLVALMIPVVQSMRENARRMTCSSSPKQLAVAFHNYHDKYGSFPPAYSVDENGKPLHSWRVLILPFIDQKELYGKIRLDEPWDSPYNSQFHKQCPRYFFSCPSREKERLDGLAHYQMVIGPDTISAAPDGIKLSDISHHSETFLFIEASVPVPWMSPQDLPQSALANGVVSSRPQRGKPVVQGIGSPHRNGAYVSMIDAYCPFLSTDTPPEKLLEYSRIKPVEKENDKELNSD
jgi:hypothetical protein